MNCNQTINPARLLAAIALLALALPAFALTPPPPPPSDELAEFYHATGGDDWVHSDGWLDPEVHFCDWYGVECDSVWGGFISGLNLPANNLTGSINDLALIALLRDRLNLRENRLSGSLTALPFRIASVDLARNQLEGPLPDFWTDDIAITPPPDITATTHLDLSGNAFEGAVPADWNVLRIRHLDLGDNQLDAGHLNAFEAMSPNVPGHLFLAGNPFSAELSDDIFPSNLARNDGGFHGGGLDLCFNDFEINDPEVAQWVAERHVGGADFDQCLGRERVAIDANVSGSWYHPDRSGEGVSLMLLDTGAPLLYHFGFDTQGGQQWLFEVGVAGEQYLEWDELLETRGSFNSGLRFDGDHPFVRDSASFRMDRIDRDTFHLYRLYAEHLGCGDWEHADPDRPPGPGLCPIPYLHDRMDYTRISELAGSRCELQTDFMAWSGAWFNPERTGEGFIIEALPDNSAVIYWFTYQPDGSHQQAWMIADGTFESGPGDVIGIPIPGPDVVARIMSAPTYQPLGGHWGAAFDADEVNHVEWGLLSFVFYDDGTAAVAWESKLEEYGSGHYELQRLARPMLPPCDDFDAGE